VLRPVSELGPLPPDVEKLAVQVRREAPTPTVGVNIPRGPVAALEGFRFTDGEGERPQPPHALPTQGLAGQSTAPKLDHWTVKAHVYTKDVAADIKILTGLFGIKGTHVSAGVVHEAKRYRIERTDDGTLCEIGVAVRLIAATTQWEVNADISIPNIAAAVNLNAKVGDARIGIEVTGYAGPLGDLLPAPSKLDVSTLVDYVSAFQKVQRQVFGEAGLPFLTPALINWDDGEDDGEDDGQ
jgi:hypothetical protein